MAETDLFPIEPDFTLPYTWDDGATRSRTLGRKHHQRLTAPPIRAFRLVFRGRPSADHESLLDWWRRFEASFFRFDHKVYLVEAGAYLTRSFPVVFVAPPRAELVSNEAWDMECELVEAPGRPLPAANYPTFAAGHPFVAVTGSDVGADKIVIYAGYGFRSINAGASTIVLDGTSLGVAPITKTDVNLGLHQVKILGAAATSASIETLI